jgi:hypothetical protein
MRRSAVHTAIASLLIFSISYSQVVPAFGANDRKKVQVAFVGIRFEDVPADVQKRVLERVTNVLSSESALRVVSPREAQKKLGAEKIAAVLDKPDSNSFQNLAEELQVDYIFAGDLANRSRDPNRVLLVGELNRFDRATGILNKFELVKYYDNLGVEMVKFREQYVKTIVPTISAKKTVWPWVILASVGVAGLIAMTLTTSKSGSEGEPPTGVPETP